MHVIFGSSFELNGTIWYLLRSSVYITRILNKWQTSCTYSVLICCRQSDLSVTRALGIVNMLFFAYRLLVTPGWKLVEVFITVVMYRSQQHGRRGQRIDILCFKALSYGVESLTTIIILQWNKGQINFWLKFVTAKYLLSPTFPKTDQSETNNQWQASHLCRQGLQTW